MGSAEPAHGQPSRQQPFGAIGERIARRKALSAARKMLRERLTSTKALRLLLEDALLQIAPEDID